MLFTFCLLTTGCSDFSYLDENSLSSNADTIGEITDNYHIGDEIVLADVKFNIYKIDEQNNELYLLAQNVVEKTLYDDKRSGNKRNDYNGSKAEYYVEKFVYELKEKGINVNSSGLIDVDDLFELGFKRSDNLAGFPYYIDNAPDFVTYESDYWVGGYCKYGTLQWVFGNYSIDTEPCDEEHFIRPAIVISPQEIGKELPTVDPNLKIQDIISKECAWVIEGGLYNPYDKFYFDCENMKFVNTFISPDLNTTAEYNMIFVDEQTVQVDGIRPPYDDIPATIHVVDENKLRIKFENWENNVDFCYLCKVDE